MRFFVVLRYIGFMLLISAVFLLISVLVSLFNGTDTGFYPLLLSFLLTATLGAFPMIFVNQQSQISTKEGYLIVAGAWIVACVIGTLPYLLWGGEFSMINAWFESVSGFTTTGSSILDDVEALPQSLLFWRSSTHWMGGIGVVMFALIVLPSMGQSKMKMANLEMSSMAKENFRYRTQKIVQILLMVYVGLTVACFLLLHMAGMGWFDAVNNAFSTVATGGFSTRNLSIAYYNSAWIEMIMVFFMVVSGLHFGLIFATLTGKGNNIFKSEISRYYLLFILTGSLVVSCSLWINNIYPTFLTSLRYGVFQVATITSTSGFATADSSVWPPLAIMILLVCTFQCACAGSTSGGIKSDRALLIFKAIRAQIQQRQHPNAVIKIKMNGLIQEDNAVNLAVLFTLFYFVAVFFGTLLVTAFGVDLMTGFGAIAASMGNVGPGFGMVGSMSNYGHQPVAVKFLCTIYMLLGRLELYGFIQLFFIRRWL